MGSNYPFKLNGYIYSPKTAQGFDRMKRHGIPRPLFSIQDKLAKILKDNYRALTRSLMKEIKTKLQSQNITLDNAPDTDNAEELLRYFEEMGEELRKENEKFVDRINLNTVAEQLRREWFEEDQAELERLKMNPFYTDQVMREKMKKVFSQEQKWYMRRLMEDAPVRLQGVVASFSIDKKKFFEDNLEAVKELYLDNSIKRIAGEESLLKRRILQRIVDYATGKSDTLKLADLVREGYEGSDSLARLFARDQMQRFNKACTLATFKSAAVTKVKWMTCGDVRVRPSHKALNGKVFDVNDLPEEIDDYNCRCGLIPVEWADD